MEAGYTSVPDLTDGIWLVQNMPNVKSKTSLIWRVGDLKRPVDVVTHASLQTMTDDLASYLSRLGDPESNEFKEANEICSHQLGSGIRYYNVSASDLCSLFIREISKKLEKTVK